MNFAGAKTPVVPDGVFSPEVEKLTIPSGTYLELSGFGEVLDGSFQLLFVNVPNLRPFEPKSEPAA